jgi:hypothetical protein
MAGTSRDDAGPRLDAGKNGVDAATRSSGTHHASELRLWPQVVNDVLAVTKD